ncbi:hypothetical protein BX600DRAFT_58428 [Xylariales sp. PMI_506]|nr:hypothetical protein BX600DRAFT_58428 [Xylariales sp. PMI_506]
MCHTLGSELLSRDHRADSKGDGPPTLMEVGNPHPPVRRKYAWRTKPRAFYSRSRTGCKTCKIRRVRCDEARPACQKCTSTGRTCDGYSATPTLSTPQEDDNEGQYTNPNVLLLTTGSVGAQAAPFLPQALSSVLPITPIDGETLRFFQLITIPQLNRYRGSTSWGTILLQFASNDICTRHASLALGYLHRALLDQPSASSQRRGGGATLKASALEHYNQAIRHLIPSSGRRVPPTSTNAILVTCYLFICLENLLGNPPQSLAHLHNGLKLLAAEKDVDEDISWQLRRLDLQAAASEPSWVPAPSPPRRNSSKISCGAEILSPISSLLSAQDRLDILMLDAFRFRRPEVAALDGADKYFWPVSPQEAHLRRTELLRGLDGWMVQMKAFLVRHHASLNESERQLGQLLRLQCTTGRVFLSVDEYVGEERWDDLTSDFLTITSLAASIQSFRQQDRVGLDFTLVFGLVPALFLTGVKCRHPTIRRQSLALLAAPQREGAWDSILAAKVVEHTMALEEDGLEVFEAADVPVSRRMRRVWFRKDPDSSRAVDTYRQPIDTTGSALPIIHEHITW